MQQIHDKGPVIGSLINSNIQHHTPSSREGHYLVVQECARLPWLDWDLVWQPTLLPGWRVSVRIDGVSLYAVYVYDSLILSPPPPIAAQLPGAEGTDYFYPLRWLSAG